MNDRNLFANLTFEERSELVKRLDKWSRHVRDVYFDGSKFLSSHDGCGTRAWWQELNRLESEVAAWTDDWKEFPWF